VGRIIDAVLAVRKRLGDSHADKAFNERFRQRRKNHFAFAGLVTTRMWRRPVGSRAKGPNCG
jgi:hypothetical protein